MRPNQNSPAEELSPVLLNQFSLDKFKEPLYDVHKKVDIFDRSSNRMSILKGRKIPYNNDETFLYNSVKKADKIWTAIGPIFLISSDYIQLLNSRNLGLSEDKTTSCIRLY